MLGVCEIYRLNPDGTKGTHIRTEPGFSQEYLRGFTRPYGQPAETVNKQRKSRQCKYDWDKVMPQIEQLVIVEGNSIKQATDIVGVFYQAVMWQINQGEYGVNLRRHREQKRAKSKGGQSKCD